jgi:hypothetical protein
MIKTATIFRTALSTLALVSSASATERRFAFTYETTTAPKGSFEVETTTLWESGKGFDTFLFRPEIEFGITDRFQLAFYLGDIEHAREAGANSTIWAGSGIEAIYQLTDPNKSALGSALYFETILNDNDLELEGKILLQKNFGRVILAWNGVVEAHWEDGYETRVGVLEQTLGLSYQLNPGFSVGLEAKQEVAFDDWSDSQGNAVFVGPNISYRKGSFFGAATCLFRVSDVPGEPHSELGVVMGLHF